MDLQFGLCLPLDTKNPWKNEGFKHMKEKWVPMVESMDVLRQILEKKSMADVWRCHAFWLGSICQAIALLAVSWPLANILYR